MPETSKPRSGQKSGTAVDAHVGRRLRERRLLLGLSQEALGAMLGVSFQQVQKYETGANRVSASRLYRLTQVLGVSIAWFFEGLAVGGAKTGETPEPLPQLDSDAWQFVGMYFRIRSAAARSRLRELAAVLAGKRRNTD